MTRLRTSSFALLLTLAAAPLFAGEPTFKKHDINPKSPFEAAGAFDVDNDGDIDIVSGTHWYEAPKWTAHPVRDVQKVGTYYNCFSTIPMDVDGDGDTDFISCSYFGKNVGWVENPGTKGKPWTYHNVDEPGPSEAAVAIDLTGDGQPEILPNTVNTIVFFQPRGKGEFKKYDFGTAAAGHGVGTGDINGDGRLDLLTPKGWFEAPANRESETWPWHGGLDLGATGIQILGRDIDGDGLADLVWGNGHARGLFWMKQQKGPNGERTWSERMTIDPKLSSVHTLIWADLNGDGKDDELLTGKRVYAHEREEGDVEGSVVAYYRYDRNAKAWKRFPLFEGEPATNAPDDPAKRDAQKDFPPGTAGTGLEMAVIDIDKDGDLDVVCPGKSGLYLFENTGTK
jgi:hypothetical protein